MGIKLLFPVCGARVSSPFGTRVLHGVKELHPGIDLAAPIGTPVLAAAAGVVLESRLSDNVPKDWKPGDPRPTVMGWGHRIVIDHGAGFVTTYNHQSERLVLRGQRVAQGEQIGKVGSTGFSYGSHLHFELRLNGRALNPADYWLPEAPDSSVA